MLKIGCHLSAAGGYLAMGQEALSIGANTFQFFTRNPRGGQAKALNKEDVTAFRHLAVQEGLLPVLAHAPYTLNPASAEPRIREFALLTLADDMNRLSHIPESLYNLHPGSHVGQGTEAGIRLICDALNQALQPEQTTPVLLETMAGKGSEIGWRFEELQAIIEGIALGDRMGVCLDTCHVYCAGYDIVGDLDGVLAEFDAVIGLNRLRAVHLNDSMHPLGSRKDRHARLGEGTLGMETFRKIITHPLLQNIPFYLETPNDPAGHGEEISTLRALTQK